MSEAREALRWYRWLLVALAVSAGAAAGAQESAPGGGRPSILELLPETARTQHGLDLPGETIRYAAEAGTLPLRDGSGATTAEIFFTAYVAEPRDPERPIAFAFNGGPGAASAFLNLGGLGPRAVAFAPSGAVLPPPARLADNPDTWLAFTDLVFVDPVGTGYSRTPDPAKAADFWGVDRDVDAMAAFIRLFLARNDRIGSPLFLVGESYGGFRAALLARALQTDSGVAPSGIAMISPALEFSLLRGAEDYQPLRWALDLPGMAAVALERGGVSGAAALADRLAAVERFALGDYLADLADGIAARPATVETLARHTGLDPQVVREADGRVPVGRFVRELAKRDGRAPSLYDGALDGPDPEPQSARPSAPDAVLDRSVPAFSAAFARHVREELGYRTDVTFRLLNGEIGGRWDYGATPQRPGFRGALDDLQEARALNPAMRVMVAHGYTDLVTPYFATKYLLGQMPPLSGVPAVELRVYEGGHMMYMRPQSRRQLAADARALFRAALADAGRGGG